MSDPDEPAPGGPDDHDDWERIGATLDWVAALIAARLDREPIDLVRPAVVVGLLAGLAAEGLIAATDGDLALVLVGVTLTLTGYGMLALLAERFRSAGGGGGARTAEADMLAPWLRRLQVLLLAALVLVVGLMLYGAVTGSWWLVARNTLELGRVGGVVLICSWLLLDGDVGMPEWLASRRGGPAPASSA